MLISIPLKAIFLLGSRAQSAGRLETFNIIKLFFSTFQAFCQIVAAAVDCLSGNYVFSLSFTLSLGSSKIQ